MNDSSNTSATESQPQLSYEAIPQLVPIAVIILLTNGVVFLLFYKRKGLRTPPNYLLLSLAISDIMTGLINIPLFLSELILNQTSVLIPALRGTSAVFHNVISFSIAYHITAITAEKYLAVVNPFGRNMMTTKTAAKVALAVWLWSTLLGTIPASWFEDWLAWEGIALYLQAGYNIICLVIVFLFPFSFILYAYCIMFRAVSSKAGLTKSLQRKNSRAFKKAANEKKAMIILLSMAIAFAVCWMPWFTLMLTYSLIYIEWLPEEHASPLEPAAHIFVIVRYVSSAINPLLYTFFKQDFWNAFRVVVLKKPPRRPSLSMRVVSQRTRGSEQIDKLLLEENIGKSSGTSL